LAVFADQHRQGLDPKNPVRTRELPENETIYIVIAKYNTDPAFEQIQTTIASVFIRLKFLTYFGLGSVVVVIGLGEVLDFFNALSAQYVPTILASLSLLAGTDLSAAHTSYNMNYRLCDYNPNTAAPESSNGCGAHTDYGTFSIIFQDGTPGLELEETPGTWVPVPGDATVVLTGWCAVILSGGRISAAKHRVRRAPGVRRLSAVLFVAPDLDVKLKPMGDSQPIRAFSDTIMRGDLDVETFKDVMGKRWRYREGNEEMDNADSLSQDNEIENMVWG
jgi:Isopenicillin N synthase and related dioxygenases